MLFRSELVFMSFDAELRAALDLAAADKCKEALDSFERIRSRNISADQAGAVLLNEAKCLQELGRFADARERLKDARRLLGQIKLIGQSVNFEIYLEFTEIFLIFAEGKRLQGIERGKAFLAKYEKDLRKDDYSDVNYELSLRIAFELVSAEQFESGVQALVSFLPYAKDEDHARILLFLGIANEKLGNHDQAIDKFKRILQSSGPEDMVVQAHYHLGAIYWKSGAAAWAKQHFLEALNLRNDLANVPLRDLYTFLANASGHLGQEEEREKYLGLARSC